MSTDFNAISLRYERDSIIQKSASEKLFTLADIKEKDDVLDVGCGTGVNTRKIRSLTKGRVVGIDPYMGMIREAEKNRGSADIQYRVAMVEDIRYQQEFDLIFCNSAFQWFQHPLLAISNCRNALHKGGRMVMQAPARQIYSPTFITAVDAATRDNRISRIFSTFRNPWFFLETAEEYRALFERGGFTVPFAVIEEQRTLHTPDQVMNIFESGAAAGYLNVEYYGVPLGTDYRNTFRDLVKKSFETQADGEGIVHLQFNRIYLVAVKE